MANEIFTRIQLKYDSYANWTSNNPTLLAGEVAIAKLVSDVTIPTDADKNAPVLFKVGPGAFNSLPWVSGLAADVYGWAKKTEDEFKAWVKGLVPVEVIDNGTGKFVTDVTVTNDANGHHITITRSDVDWTDVKNAPDFALKSEIPTELGVMSVEKKDGTAIEIDNTDAANPKVGFKIDAAAGDITLTQTNNGLKATLNKTAAGLDKVENKTTEEIKTQFTGAVADGNTGFVTGDDVHDAIADAVEQLTIGAHTYDVQAKDKSVTVTPTTAGTKTTFTVGANVPDMLSGLTGHVNRIRKTKWGIYSNQDVSMVYDAATMTYTLYQQQETASLGDQPDYDGAAKVEIGKITIPKDMVVKSGTVVTKDAEGDWGAAGTYIELVLQNVEKPIYINVGSLIEYVTSGSATGDMVVINIDSNHKVTATITDGTITKAKLEKNVQDSLDLARAAIHHIFPGSIEGDNFVKDALYLSGSSGTNEDGTNWATVDVAVKKGGITNEALSDNAVTTGKITDKHVTKAKLEQSVQDSLTRADGLYDDIWLEEGGADGVSSSEIVNGALDFGMAPYDGYDKIAKTLLVGLKKGGIVTDALADSAVTTAKINDGAVTAAKLAADVTELIKTEAATLDAVVLAESQKYTDDAIDDLHAIATSGSIYDIAEGSTANNGADKEAHPKYLIFNCGSSTTVI